MIYNVWLVIPTDDITCSLCHGVNVASVKLSQYHYHSTFIPMFHTKA